MINFYELLGVKITATKEEIKTSYRKMVKKYHPDINNSEEANKIIRSLNEAKEILLDEDKRKEYDKLLNDIKNSKQFSFTEEKEETYYKKTEVYKETYKEEYITKFEFFLNYLKNSIDKIGIKILKSIFVFINAFVFLCIKGIVIGIIFFFSLIGKFVDYIVGIFMLCAVLSLFVLIGEKYPDNVPFLPANVENFCMFSIVATIIATIKYYVLSGSSNLYVLVQNIENNIFLKILVNN